MVDAKATVRIRIAGQDHVLRSAADPEYAKRCADFLDERVAEIRTRSRVPDTHRAVVLAALQVADLYFQTVAELEALKADVADRTRALAEVLEAAVPEPAPEPAQEPGPPPDSPGLRAPSRDSYSTGTVASHMT